MLVEPADCKNMGKQLKSRKNWHSDASKHKKPEKGKGKKQGKKDDDESDGFEEISAVDFEETMLSTAFDDDDEEEEDSDAEADNTRKMIQKQNRKNKKSGGFQSMGLSHSVFTGVLRKGYKVPTPIQRKTIPLIMDRKDVVAMARTGSGKTAAFLIPMFERLKIHNAKGVRAVILSPTRELALQTLKFTKEVGKYTGLRAAVILGGDRMEDQFAALHENPDIIIATPGRFVHVAMEMDLKLQSVEYVVFDEADRLFELGFKEQLHEILGRLPTSRQTVLFSATLPRLLVEFARAGLHDPTLIRLDVDSKLSEHLGMAFLQCRSEDKTAVLLHLLQHVIRPEEQTVIFVATKHHVEYMNMILTEAGISCSYTYSSLDQTARKINVAKFRARRTSVLVVTDLAARGIDIPLLNNVINYHFPAKPKLFVHRVGRVARAGNTGTAYSLIGPDELAYVIDLHLFLGRPLKVMTANKTYPEGEDCLFGRVPQSAVDEGVELLSAWHEKVDLAGMLRVIHNGYLQYIRSRPVAAVESVKRAKEIAAELIHIHPVFGSEHQSSAADERQKLLDVMKGFRPNTTIFEINSTKKNEAFSVMKVKRKKHEDLIERVEAKKLEKAANAAHEDVPKLPSSIDQSTDADIQETFSKVVAPKAGEYEYKEKKKQKKKRKPVQVRDEENYLHYRPKDFQSERGYSLGVRTSFATEAAGAELDLTGDDAVKMKKSSQSMKWDRKRKRFVGDGGNEGKNKKIRTESGALISATYKTNLLQIMVSGVDSRRMSSQKEFYTQTGCQRYKDWLKNNKIAEQDEPDDEESTTEKKQTPVNMKRLQVIGGGQRHGKGFHKAVAPGPQGQKSQKGGPHGKRELKTKEQILKQRNIAAKREEFQRKRATKRMRKFQQKTGKKGHSR